MINYVDDDGHLVDNEPNVPVARIRKPTKKRVSFVQEEEGGKNDDDDDDDDEEEEDDDEDEGGDPALKEHLWLSFVTNWTGCHWFLLVLFASSTTRHCYLFSLF